MGIAIALSFLFFTSIPLVLISFYALNLFSKNTQEEVRSKLLQSSSILQIEINDTQKYYRASTLDWSGDRRLKYFISSRANEIHSLIQRWMSTPGVDRIRVYDRRRNILSSFLKRGKGIFREYEFSQEAHLQLPQKLNKSFFYYYKMSFEKDLWLHNLMPILGENNVLLGYLQVLHRVPKSFWQELATKNKLEIAINDKQNTWSSNDKLEELPWQSLEKTKLEQVELLQESFAFGIINLPQDKSKIQIAYGISIESAVGRERKLRGAMITALFIFLALLYPIFLFVSIRLLKPLRRLAEASQNLSIQATEVALPVRGNDEVALLTHNFNEMSRKLSKTQSELKQKLQELEKSNQNLQETQASLIQSAKMAGLGQLVAGVAHELNNPISFIYSNTQQLEEYLNTLMQLAENSPQKAQMEDWEYLKKDIPKLVDAFRDGAQRTSEIVKNLQSFARKENDHWEQVDLQELVENSLKLLDSQIKNRVSIHLDFQFQQKIYCNRNQINQVIMNLLTNASQAIEDKGKIFIRSRKEKNFYMLEVEDTGRGMDLGTQERVFDPFFTTKEVGQGTGLGLSVSYNIIEKHNGIIRVQSQVGKGSLFQVLLPITSEQNMNSVSN